MKIILIGLLMLLSAGTALAGTTYYVAPPGTAAGRGDGSREAPFPNIQRAIKSGVLAGGDTLRLLDGSYGKLVLAQVRFDPAITITSDTPYGAHFSEIRIGQKSRGLTFDGLTVWPDSPDFKGQLIFGLPGATDITVRNMDIRGAEDAADYMNWDLARWKRIQSNGIMLRGARATVTDNRITGLRFGIITSGADSVVRRNHIDGFSGDGLRGLGDNNVFAHNVVENCIDMDANHDDGFQSWSPKNNGPNSSVRGLRIEGNIIAEWTGDMSHPLRCKLQGIGMFDGYFDDLTIINNVVATAHYHGITVFGARGVVIANNTVVHIEAASGPYPWISVHAHKNGTPSSNAVIANNIAMSYNISARQAPQVRMIRNATASQPVRVYEDARGLRFTPGRASPFLDAADPSYAPPVDILGRARPAGSGPDQGAYEGPAMAGEGDPFLWLRSP